MRTVGRSWRSRIWRKRRANPCFACGVFGRGFHEAPLLPFGKPGAFPTGSCQKEAFHSQPAMMGNLPFHRLRVHSHVISKWGWCCRPDAAEGFLENPFCHCAFPFLGRYVNPNEDCVLVLVATVSAFCWPWAFRRELPTTTANYAVIVATHAGISRAKALG